MKDIPADEVNRGSQILQIWRTQLEIKRKVYVSFLFQNSIVHHTCDMH